MRDTNTFLVLLATLLTSISTPAFALEDYYGSAIAEKEAELGNSDLKSLLFEVLSQAHIQQEGRPDRLTNTCSGGGKCIQHRSLGYNGARKVLFGRLYLSQDQGEFAVEDIYCSKRLTAKDFPSGRGPGRDKIPDSNVVNAEHSWPQSKFSRQFPANLQKSDLHILFSTSSRSNSLRGNDPFGDVVTPTKKVCPESSLGYTSRGNSNHFLPPPRVRGDVARAVFYFSVRYKMPIDPEQEDSLRHWSDQDPVDENERARHEVKVELTQVRNPFIDHPEWIDLVRDF